MQVQSQTQSQPGPSSLVKYLLPLAAGLLVAAGLFAGPDLFGPKETGTSGTEHVTVEQQQPIETSTQHQQTPPAGVEIGKERPGGLSDVSVSSRSITVQLSDHGAEDGDQVLVKLNGRVIAAKITLRKAASSITLPLDPGVNTVEITALNEGTAPEPYNSARVQISDVASGQQVQELKLKMGQSAQFHVVGPN